MSRPTLRQLFYACLILGLVAISGASMAQTESATSLREAREAAETRDQQRLMGFLDDQQALESALEQARAEHEEAQQQHEALEIQQAEQTDQASELSERQAEQGEALTALLSNLARHSSEIRNALGDESLLSLEEGSLPPRLDEVEVLERHQLEEVVDRLAALTARTGRAEHLSLPVADANGEVATRELMRLGDFAAFTENELLERGENDGNLVVLPRTPDAIGGLLADYYQGESHVFAVDPTQGSVLEALAQQPSLWERFQQGGYVGYVVVALGILGLIIGLGQYLYLVLVSLRVNQQRQSLSQLKPNNPLGRVLLRFEGMDKHQTPEALEARLDEAVLAELPKLERSQPMVKLLAAIAPLLGLLGTVTGMIVTFQAITVFGTGDPQLMAGGISQALVTTVLGLITAVPLLFVQTALSGRSRYLTHVIEGQASATLADHLESHTAVVN
ncbi:MotA/TolQ/ExbB proton channel family protein [Halomonas sp. HAL1]|uniref:MotA/TolQ/ExbB proton channel family protein n=1 Tax=Halomonas sp. HAL1 TaxID=550984 RepID=UPI00022D337D|nr:MotA/TolQ/ExbB proton channel family protein [Halomonas sp. HAL1]EHA16958.1 MotA/TolQ/ExbB proton channel [Halomonas sp. HAL1]WKV94512.1 MotA/TolQ/ExbB proton channel family protein [Halomonas sp. HAL1]